MEPAIRITAETLRRRENRHVHCVTTVCSKVNGPEFPLGWSFYMNLSVSHRLCGGFS